MLYEPPEMEVVIFENTEDVITTSEPHDWETPVT